MSGRSASQSVENQWTRRQMLGLLSIGLTCGCRSWAFWRRDSEACDGVGYELAVPPRNIAISDTTSRDLGGQPHLFTVELVAAMNTTGAFNAVLLPPEAFAPAGAPALPPLPAAVDSGSPIPDVPSLPVPDGLGFPVAQEPGFPIAEETVLGTGAEELLIVQVTELLPYQPMRLSANLELRSMQPGPPYWSAHRTWEGPLDLIPRSPYHEIQKLLNHPAPLGVVEADEMRRLSPRAFLATVAHQLTAELLAVPIGAPLPPPVAPIPA